MSNFQAKNEKTLKRRSELAHIVRTSKQTDFQSVSIETLPSKQNHLSHPKSTKIQSKPIVPPRNTRQKPSTSLRTIPPPVTPRTIFKNKTETRQLPIPAPREKSYTNDENNTILTQLPPSTTVVQSIKLISSSIDSKNDALAEQKLPTRQPQGESTPYTSGLCGLNNIGNTCFMNSALQCLSNIPELTKYTQNYQLESSVQTTDITHVYTTLIQSMWSGKNKTVNPRNIKTVVSRSAPIFADYGQKDSHEFMNSLLNALEQSNFAPIISKLFHTHMQSQVTCLGCKSINTTDETTTFLPLPLPRETSSIKEILLEDLINDYRSEENLDGLYYCQSCSNYTQAKQKTIICSPSPPVLIIQLKRFPFDGTSSKIDTFVHYKLQYQNLISNNDIYQLCAISSHQGSLASGHYTTLARNYQTKQWYLFNDDHTKQIHPNEIITSHAYVLVYLKVNECDSTLL
ncbi:hypothetical protein I4U23_007005 [Adineta vaga]|nr:hypothetical protein I4U23_007005 [Adineta vaga]